MRDHKIQSKGENAFIITKFDRVAYGFDLEAAAFSLRPTSLGSGLIGSLLPRG